jgi:hypothetical protein
MASCNGLRHHISASTSDGLAGFTPTLSLAVYAYAGIDRTTGSKSGSMAQWLNGSMAQRLLLAQQH